MTTHARALLKVRVVLQEPREPLDYLPSSQGIPGRDGRDGIKGDVGHPGQKGERGDEGLKRRWKQYVWNLDTSGESKDNGKIHVS